MVSKTLKKIYQIILLIAVGTVISRCVEPFDAKTEIFENTLVIEATITNEFKKQEITLSRTFRFEDLGLNHEFEQNADVTIIDDAQNEYLFQETTPGKYVSITEFSAQINIAYQLYITTSDGRRYTSNPTSLPEPTPIHDIQASRIISSDNQEGMGIFVQYDPAQNSKFYRYEYEEAYKIIAPKWKGVTIRFIGQGETITWPKGPDGRVCYKIEASDNLIINKLTGFGDGQVPKFPIRFINRDDYIISHRYSILIKQFAISKETYTYFETLKKFSGQDDIFSQTQPGFFNGNVYSENNADENVLGFFDVTSVSIERIFFDYIDFFPNEPLPPYVEEPCNPYIPVPSTIPRLLSQNIVEYYDTNAFGQHRVVSKVCGDCRLLGNTEVPEFWIE